MYLYNFTIQQATGITHSICGNFSGRKQQEILVSRGKILELLHLQPDVGKIETLVTVEVFGNIRSLIAFRLQGNSKDYVIIGSDSGQVVVLEYCLQRNIFEKVYQETFGKSGSRRTTPGQYLAADTCGRAIMISAVENENLFYIVNRDQEAKLMLSSPLEIFRKNTCIYHTVGIEIPLDTVVFASLEIEYEETDNKPTGETAHKPQQKLAFYELDLESKNVVCKYSETLEERANYLVPVPGGKDGPGGLLICCENCLIYQNLGDQENLCCPIPQRKNNLDNSEHGMLFVCVVTFRADSMFFFLAQTEQGDIFKITLEITDYVVTEIQMKYFDTVPVASAMCVLKTGFLFVASEFGNHYLYKFVNLGDDDEPIFSSKSKLEKDEIFLFIPRRLRNLVLVDELNSLSPIMACQVADLTKEDVYQLYMLCGRGPRSTARVLRHGLEISEVAVAQLPGNPNAIWTLKQQAEEKFDSYVVVSFTNATLVFSVGEIVEEITDSGFLGTTPTLSCSSIGEDSMVQIYPSGIRHIQADKGVNEWPAPSNKAITQCAVNQQQIIIALTGGTLIYFEMDPSGQLEKYTEHKELPSEVVCMALASVPQGELCTCFLAVGLADSNVLIIRLERSGCFTLMFTQILPAVAESLCILETGAGMGVEEESDMQGYLHLNIGLKSGHLLQTMLDRSTGSLSEASTHYLGSQPLKLFRICVHSREGVLAISNRSWLNYYYQDHYNITPLLYDSLEYVSSFSSAVCPEGIVAITSDTLRILALEKLSSVFSQISFPLYYTPRKFVIHEESSHLIIVETDHNAYTEETKKQRRMQMAEDMQEIAVEEEQELIKEIAEAFLNDDLPENIFSAPKAGSGMWASVVRILDPREGHTMDLVKLEQNEAALSVTIVKFTSHPDETFVVVGVVKDYRFNPCEVSDGFLYTFKLDSECLRLQLVHCTAVEGAPICLRPFEGHLLAGVGHILRLYDLGKKKLLRKCENKNIPNFIVDIQTMRQRVFVSDTNSGVYFVNYKPIENELIIFADTIYPQKITNSAILDYDTIATTDKFGNIAVFRLTGNISEEVDKNPTIMKDLPDKGLLRGASQKARLVAHFHIGEMCTSLQKTTLIAGGNECLLYTTLSGTVGVLAPFTSHEDQEFFQHLQIDMRSENPPLCGREHLYFRSYYHSLKNVIDGDLCEQFNSLDVTRQKSIAAELDTSPHQVSKKLEEMRKKYAF